MMMLFKDLVLDARYNSLLDSHKDFYIRMMAIFDKDKKYPLPLLEPDTLRKLLYPAPDRFDGGQHMYDCISTALDSLEMRGLLIRHPDVYDEEYPQFSQKGYFQIYEPNGLSSFPQLTELLKQYEETA